MTPEGAAPGALEALVQVRDAARCAAIAEDFRSASPFPHLCLDDFLAQDFVERLRDSFPAPGEPGYAECCTGEDGGSTLNYANGDPSTFPAAFRELDALCRDPAFIGYVASLTGIDGLTFDPEYIGGGLRASSTGAVLPPHLDFNYHPRTQMRRRLNLLLYLNAGWEPHWGGNIQMHKDPRVERGESLAASFTPILNRVVVFETSEHSWHAFDRVCAPAGRMRLAWSIYYYTPRDAAADQAAPRNTEYVEPGLPGRFAPGHRLDASDVELLREMLDRRDRRIAMLYALRRDFDGKYAHLWGEYEYYLNKYRELAGSGPGSDSGS